MYENIRTKYKSYKSFVVYLITFIMDYFEDYLNRIRKLHEYTLNKINKACVKFGLIKEYYSSDNIGGNYKILIRGEGKDMFPCHLHLFDGKSINNCDTINLEISIPDYRIVNVDKPYKGSRDWDDYPEARDYFFSYLSNKDKEIELLKQILYYNPTNKHRQSVIDYAINHYKDSFKNIQI